jgi:hypothetical protein
MPSGITQDDIEMVRTAGHKLMMDAPGLVGDRALLTVAALSMAVAGAAVLLELSYEDLAGLVQSHYEAAAVGLVARDLADQGIVVATPPKPEGQS